MGDALLAALSWHAFSDKFLELPGMLLTNSPAPNAAWTAHANVDVDFVAPGHLPRRILVQISSMSTSAIASSPPGSGSGSSLLNAAIRGARGCCPAGGRGRGGCEGAAGASAASPCSRICSRPPACGPRRALLWPLGAALLHAQGD